MESTRIVTLCTSVLEVLVLSLGPNASSSQFFVLFSCAVHCDRHVLTGDGAHSLLGALSNVQKTGDRDTEKINEELCGLFTTRFVTFTTHTVNVLMIHADKLLGQPKISYYIVQFELTEQLWTFTFCMTQKFHIISLSIRTVSGSMF
jgi:hypothetical protein